MALTPMMQQYFDAKNKHKDALVFFHLGDFYEMFYDDAEVGDFIRVRIMQPQTWLLKAERIEASEWH